MPKRSGQYFDCVICGEKFYRQPSHVRRGITKTCGKQECKSQYFMRENNPFWGQTHTPEVREIISRAKAKPGPKPGFKHTQEARDAMSAALRERWKTNRDGMLANAKVGLNLPRHELQDEPHHLVKFTDVQKKLWIDKECFYCLRTDDLVLDHILPTSCGGKNVRPNAQTLCQDCNRWKMRFVDLPLYFAMLGHDRG